MSGNCNKESVNNPAEKLLVSFFISRLPVPYRFKKYIAFTLAEVLITLTVIGVIAALTIPSIIQNTQDAEFRAAGKKAFSEISGVINRMKQDRGTVNDYIGNANSFKPDFIKYFSVSQDCGNTTCVPSTYTSNMYNSLTGNQADTTIGGEGQFVTNDGKFINIQNSSLASYGVMIVVDVNGYQHGPNVYGRDVFVFQIVNDNLLPMGAQGTKYSLLFCDKTVPDPLQGIACAVYMLQNKSY